MRSIMKYERIEIRLNKQEKEHLHSQAKKSGLRLSEYIRAKTLDEAVDDINLQQKSAMTYVNLMSYLLLGKLARKQLSQDEIEETKHKTNNVLKKWNIEQRGI